MIDVLNLFNMLVRLYLPTISSDIYGAKGNSGDMVTKDINGSIDATKYLTKMRYDFND